MMEAIQQRRWDDSNELLGLMSAPKRIALCSLRFPLASSRGTSGCKV
jgi:hypothetical protein